MGEKRKRIATWHFPFAWGTWLKILTIGLRAIPRELSNSSRDVAMATNFMANFGYMRSFGRTAIEQPMKCIRLHVTRYPVHPVGPRRPYVDDVVEYGGTESSLL